MPGQMPMGQPGMPGQMPMGQPGMPGQMPMGQPGMPGQMPMGQPMGGPIMLGGTSANIAHSAKRSMNWVIFTVALTVIPMIAIPVYLFVDFGSVTGDGPEGGYCSAAAECCRVVSGSTSSACDTLESGVPVETCKQSLKQFKETAERMGKSCD
jgi:hypothetical protein